MLLLIKNAEKNFTHIKQLKWQALLQIWILTEFFLGHAKTPNVV